VRDLSPILSSLKRQEKEEALQKAIAEHERFIQSIWGRRGRPRRRTSAPRARS
jgi:hypothetical protein